MSFHCVQHAFRPILAHDCGTLRHYHQFISWASNFEAYAHIVQWNLSKIGLLFFLKPLFEKPKEKETRDSNAIQIRILAFYYQHITIGWQREKWFVCVISSTSFHASIPHPLRGLVFPD